jgi:hypothetical protein
VREHVHNEPSMPTSVDETEQEISLQISKSDGETFNIKVSNYLSVHGLKEMI